MDMRTMEDLLIGLFDPLMSDVERLKLLKRYPRKSVQPLDEAMGVDAPDGIEIVFQDGVSLVLAIIDPNGGK